VIRSEPIRVLYMEDDPGLARLVQKKLERAGYVVDLAHDGEEGLATYEAGSYDVVAVDQAMPIHDGLEVIRILASQGPLPPTVMVTGAGDEKVAVEAMKLGARDYIVKDVDGGYLELLPTVIERAIQQQQLVHERQRAEEALRESEARCRGLFEGVPVGLYRTTPEGQIIDANPALVHLLGYPDRETLMEINVGDLYVEARERQRWQMLMDREKVVHGFEMQLRRNDGAPIWVRDIARVIQDSDGRTLYYEGSLEDITERNRLEEQVQQQERMAAIGQLAGGIAHDFNNILAGITLSVQMLLIERCLPGDLAPDLENILDDARRAAQLVEQILDFSRRSYFETCPMDLSAFIQEVTGILRRILPENIRVLLELGQDEYVVQADPARMKQVLLNLAVNARDAMPRGGELRIGLSRIEVEPGEEPPVAEMDPGEWVCLSVLDAGMGISSEAMSHLFEPFFTTKQVGQGRGLGLAQVDGIVTQHGGHIGVTTGVGRGTTFYIYLPAYRPQQAARDS
jgi:two-component system cell cycle sensor histidine kinase/response regulator CckA